NSNNWVAADTSVVYNNELEAYKPDNAYVQDGNLVLEAKKESYKGKDYTSGKLVTKGKHSWTYGRFEIRAKMPESKGMWPAIWMLPEDDNILGAWPSGGEIDIMELLGHQPNKIYGTIHYGNPHASGQGTYTLPTGTFSDSYHVYALEWDPGELRWYIDGTLYHTEKNWYSRDLNEADSFTYPAPFNRDFHLILNLAVGGDWPGSPDSTTVFPGKMYVDYVRTYERTGGVYPAAGERPQDSNSTVRPPVDGNYIYNGSFDKQVSGVDGMKNNGGTTDIPNTSYWTFSHVDANDGSAVVSNDSGALKVDISNPGPNPYSVQLYQKPINLEKSSSYRVTFDAWASVSRNISVKLGSEADRGWANYSGDQSIALTASHKQYQFDFKMTGDTNPAARLEFNVGKEGSTTNNIVWIDNVRVEKLPNDDNAPRDGLPSGNLIYNGTFDQGSKSMGFWNFKASGSAIANGYVTPNIYDRKFQADITNKGTSPDSIILSQSGLNIENGKQYSVSFYAMAASSRNIKVNVGSSTDPSVNYSTDQTINLGTDMTRYTFKFTMTEATDTKAQLQFKLGGDTSKVYIDNVALRSCVPGQDIHVEAEAAATHGAINPHSSYITFGDGSYISKSINVPEAGNYVISYRLSTSGGTGWLSAGDTEHNEALPDTGGSTNWVNVTNSVYLGQGIQDINIYGNAVNLDWFEISKDLVLGGNMTPPASNWAYWSTTGENANSTKSVEDGKLKVAITAAGANPWSIGINQSGISLGQGRLYRISFDAKSTVDRSIRVSVDKADYSKYFTKDLDITTTMKNYIIDFPMSATDANCTLTFSIGNVSGAIATTVHDVYLDNVRMTEIDDIYCQSLQSINAPSIPEPVVTPPDTGNNGEVTNIITDGTFETGIGSWGSYGGAGAVSISASGGKLVANVTSVGGTNYEPQVKRNNLSLTKYKTYAVTFNASASTDRAVEVSILDPNDGYRYFGGNKFTISSSNADYAFTFTAPATTSTASLQFNLGTVSGLESASVAASVYLDNISLVEVKNLINDGTFDSDIGSWTKYQGSGSASIGVSGGKLAVDVTGVSSDNYDPQVKRGGLSFTKDGVYAVSFNASANTDRAVEVAVIDPANGYAYYGGSKYDISTSSKEYALVFTAPASTKTAELQFNLGLIGGHTPASVAASVYLDDIVITPVYVPDTAPVVVSNDLINDTFDKGMGSWSFGANGGAGSADVVANGSNKELRITVTTVGANNYQPQLQKSGLALENGATYKLTFKARATVPRTIEASFLELGTENQYDWYGGSKLDITDQVQTFTITFTAKRSTPTAALQINFGTVREDSGNILPSDPSTIYLDDIVLTKQ
ncbi:MAG TPA: carbohydrate binding domain-containing protein, partial [Clostridia bacterium]